MKRFNSVVAVVPSSCSVIAAVVGDAAALP